MNKTLIGWLDGINNLLAILLIAVSAVVGFATGIQSHVMNGIVLGLAGLVAGFVLAAVICGLLATLIEIHKNLARLLQIHDGREKQD